MFVDPAATARQLMRHDVEIAAGTRREDDFCTKGTRLIDAKVRLATEARKAALIKEWEPKYKKIDAAFQVKLKQLQADWASAAVKGTLADADEGVGELGWKGGDGENELVGADLVGKHIWLYWPEHDAWHEVEVLWWAGDGVGKPQPMVQGIVTWGDNSDEYDAGDNPDDDGDDDDDANGDDDAGIDEEVNDGHIYMLKHVDTGLIEKLSLHKEQYTVPRDNAAADPASGNKTKDLPPKNSNSNTTPEQQDEIVVVQDHGAGRMGERRQQNRDEHERESVGNNVTVPTYDREQRSITVIVPENIGSFHWYLSPQAAMPNGCNVPCVFTHDFGLHATEADAVVYLGDEELYSSKEHVLPPKAPSNPSILYYAILREYTPLYPTSFWAKYDGRVTYQVVAPTPDADGADGCADNSLSAASTGGNRVGAATYNYASPWYLEEGKASPSFADRSKYTNHALAAHVSIRCGNPDNPNDGRGRRTKLVTDLQAIIVKTNKEDNGGGAGGGGDSGGDGNGDGSEHSYVDAYGQCGGNITPWPKGKEKDKHFVMQTHKFCIAMESNADDDYVTEKLWDCLRAGSVPIYWGAANVGKYLPGGEHSAIFVEDFDTAAELAAHLKIVGNDEALWESYRGWTRMQPPYQTAEWKALMQVADVRNSKCNVCKALAFAKSNGNAAKPSRSAGSNAENRGGSSSSSSSSIYEIGGADTVGAAAEDPRTWSVNAVVKWAAEHHFDPVPFLTHHVNGKLLEHLNEAMMEEELEITSKLGRKRLMLEIEGLFLQE